MFSRHEGRNYLFSHYQLSLFSVRLFLSPASNYELVPLHVAKPDKNLMREVEKGLGIPLRTGSRRGLAVAAKVE